MAGGRQTGHSLVDELQCDEAPVVALHGEKRLVRTLVPLGRPIFQQHHQPALRIALDPLLDDFLPGILAVLLNSVCVQDGNVRDHETLG
jgi:hypothetical protein